MTSSTIRTIQLAFVSCLGALLLTGCGLLRSLEATEQASQDKDPLPKPLGIRTHFDDLNTPEQIESQAQELGLFAMFSHLSYLKHLPEDQRNPDHDCTTVVQGHPMATIDTGSMEQGVWRQWARWSARSTDGKLELGCLSKEGAYLEVYALREGSDPASARVTHAVVAIRGTENYPGQRVRDWWTSLGVALLATDPKEYILSRKHIELTLGELRRQYPGVKIYLTGHSLGGGMAQQSAFIERVKRTYAFNTSPVTNWSVIKTDDGLNQRMHQAHAEDPYIVRFTEDGEFLSFLRATARFFTHDPMNRKDYRARFIEANPFEGHSIAITSCNFAMAMLCGGESKANPDGLRYTKDMARAFVDFTFRKSERLCEQKYLAPHWWSKELNQPSCGPRPAVASQQLTLAAPSSPGRP